MPAVLSKLQALRNLQVSIGGKAYTYDLRTYIVGAGLTSEAKARVDAMAQAGGTAVDGRAYYADNPEQLQEALEKHESASLPLATFLVERGYCTEQQVQTAVEIQQVRRAVSARQQTASFYNPFNVMELLVNELLDEVIAEHQGCTCELCRANVFALALNNLPTRYISDHARLLIVAESTRDEYGGLIKRKVAQAVEQVKRNPRPLCRRQTRPAK
jgi:competence protein ComFB